VSGPFYVTKAMTRLCQIYDEGCVESTSDIRFSQTFVAPVQLYNAPALPHHAHFCRQQEVQAFGNFKVRFSTFNFVLPPNSLQYSTMRGDRNTYYCMYCKFQIVAEASSIFIATKGIASVW
jgi:hypothetical protein